MMKESSYRPHNPGHDYYDRGIYLITLVVRDRERNAQMLGRLNDDIRHPDVVNNEVGKGVMEEWAKVPAFEDKKGRKVKIYAAVCMPDHFHGVIEVMERMDVSVGQVIWGFKVACTKRWRQLGAQPGAALPGAAQPGEAQPGAAQPKTAVNGSGGAGQPSLAVVPDLHRMSRRQRAVYYAEHPEAGQPLWDDNYDDTICLTDPLTGGYDRRHLGAMCHYVADNARRAVMRRLRPEFMERCLHVEIEVVSRDGRRVVREYAAFGNLFLLRWARKVQVFCHRRAPDGHTPYETTEEFRQRCREWKREVMEGQTVMVTPGISKGELLIKNRCLECGYPLIHLQKEPIGRWWKPELRRFDACCQGRLLVLAPWRAECLGDVGGVPSATDYSVFHNLNMLAEEICGFEGVGRIF